MPRLWVLIVALIVISDSTRGAGQDPIVVEIHRDASGDVDAAEIVARLAEASRLTVPRPTGRLALKLDGVSGALSKTLLTNKLGADVTIRINPKTVAITVPASRLAPERIDAWQRNLRELASAVDEAAQRRAGYGFHARPSYRPNDSSRPTVCLVHGVNSSSRGFVHMFGPLEEAGFGIVVYDYPYNRSLAQSGAEFTRDWKAFRRNAGETRPWAIVAHSMGALLARSYVEDPAAFEHDVSDLIMIAPVNQGSSLARGQTLLQLVKGVRAANGKPQGNGLLHLSDGLGEAAEDMSPGSPFLRALNPRPRAPGVAYHILAGDVGVLNATARRQIEDQVSAARRDQGLLGGLARIAAGDLGARLDELTTGTGDGCVSVANTKLDGVADHVTIHANHAELIRAPVLFADPGPVACMPYLLRWLGGKPGPGTDAAR